MEPVTWVAVPVNKTGVLLGLTIVVLPEVPTPPAAPEAPATPGMATTATPVPLAGLTDPDLVTGGTRVVMVVLDVEIGDELVGLTLIVPCVARHDESTAEQAAGLPWLSRHWFC